jgi:hypothetical protein
MIAARNVAKMPFSAFEESITGALSKA